MKLITIIILALALTSCKKKEKCFTCISYRFSYYSGLTETGRTTRCGDEALIKLQAAQVQQNNPNFREFCTLKD